MQMEAQQEHERQTHNWKRKMKNQVLQSRHRKEECTHKKKMKMKMNKEVKGEQH